MACGDPGQTPSSESPADTRQPWSMGGSLLCISGTVDSSFQGHINSLYLVVWWEGAWECALHLAQHRHAQPVGSAVFVCGFAHLVAIQVGTTCGTQVDAQCMLY